MNRILYSIIITAASTNAAQDFSIGAGSAVGLLSYQREFSDNYSLQTGIGSLLGWGTSNPNSSEMNWDIYLGTKYHFTGTNGLLVKWEHHIGEYNGLTYVSVFGTGYQYHYKHVILKADLGIPLYINKGIYLNKTTEEYRSTAIQLLLGGSVGFYW